jgi:non-specific serine/threonine protein kinase/serine/threonine-protein kinase
MHDGLGTILVREKKYSEAERELDLAWKVIVGDRNFGEAHPRSQEVVDHYVELYSAWEKPEKEAAWRAKKVAAKAQTSHS